MIVERLLNEPLGPDVVVEDLFFGALAVCQRLQELHPEVLILVGAAARGLEPGRVLRREVAPLKRPLDDLQHAVGEAATGYVSIDLVLEVATAFHALPARTLVFEIEPKTTAPADTLSPEGQTAASVAIDMIKLELRSLAMAH